MLNEKENETKGKGRKYLKQVKGKGVEEKKEKNGN